MLALLLATQLAAAPTPAITSEWAQAHPPPRARLPLNPIPEACRAGVMAVAGPSLGAFRPGLHKLTDLPKPHLEIAVERSVGGCPAPIIVRYDVEGDGRAASGGAGR